MKLPAFAIMLCFIFASMFPSQSSALSCAEFEDPAIDYYDAAVAGTVLNVKEDVVQEGFTGPKDKRKVVLLEVERSWEKEFPSQVIFEADFSWGFDFIEGEKYLIYLNEANGEYINGPCSPVSAAPSADEYEDLPGKGLEPGEKVDLEHKMWFLFNKDVDILFASLMVGVPLAFLWHWRKKEKQRMK